MYKIYINNLPLLLIDKEETDYYKRTIKGGLFATYLGKPKFFFKFIDMLEKQSQTSLTVVISCIDVVKAFTEFCSQYQIIEAGGGVVKNPKGEILMIFRRGFWDLPKGKMDPQENMMQTAAREVKEETGLSHVNIENHLTTTLHTYRTGKGKRVLKKCTWFSMKSNDLNLTPQTEEDIEEAKWVNLKEFLSTNPKIFKNILDVLSEYTKGETVVGN